MQGMQAAQFGADNVSFVGPANQYMANYYFMNRRSARPPFGVQFRESHTLLELTTTDIEN